jgi:ribosome-binding factor A
MPSHRSLRIAEAVREVVASAILFEVADPRVRAVTVLGVEVSGDLRNATVHVSVMGSEAEQRTAMTGLARAAGFLQARVAARLQTRFTPALTFKLDDSVKRSIAISRLIDDALAADRRGPDDEDDPGDGPDDDGPDDDDGAPDDEGEPGTGQEHR